MGGGDQAYIHPQGLLAAHALEGAILQYPQEPHLNGRGQLADFVEKEGAAIGALEPTQAAIGGAGEAAAFVTEEFRVHQVRRYGATIDPQKGPLGPGRADVNGPGNDLLARARLTENQNRSRRGGD